MIRFKKSNCGELVSGHHLHKQNLHVSFSDRELDVYENQFIGHQVPKKGWMKNKESTFIQFSRRYQQGELKSDKGDSLLMEVFFDEETYNFEEVEECVTRANYYYFMPSTDKNNEEEEDYTKCMLHTSYKEQIDWEETLDPPITMPETKSCSKSQFPRIAGGQETKKGRYPWFAWSEKMGEAEKLNCGLTILTKNEDGSDDWLLTDSRCCTDDENDWFIHIGAHDLEYPGNNEYIINPIIYFIGEIPDNSQCMVMVPNLIDNAPESCSGGSCFEPVCLSDEELKDGTSCFIAGFGGPEQAQILRDAPLIFLDGEFRSLDQNDPAKACLGDVGGALICLVDDYPIFTGVLHYNGGVCYEINDESYSSVVASDVQNFLQNPPSR